MPGMPYLRNCFAAAAKKQGDILLYTHTFCKVPLFSVSSFYEVMYTGSCFFVTLKANSLGKPFSHVFNWDHQKADIKVCCQTKSTRMTTLENKSQQQRNLQDLDFSLVFVERFSLHYSQEISFHNSIVSTEFPRESRKHLDVQQTVGWTRVNIVILCAVVVYSNITPRDQAGLFYGASHHKEKKGYKILPKPYQEVLVFL